MATPRNRNTMAPSKPHFFQPLLPGFEHQFSIPVKFFKSLKGQDCDKAILRTRVGENWPVKINGRRFEDGWKEFVQNHDLHVGDFLVFKHQGNMVFHVLVFDPSACEREFPSFATKQFHIKEEKIEEEEQLPKKSCPGNSKNKNKNKNKIRTTLDAQATTFSVLEHPYFVTKLTTSSAKLRRLHIPMRFARLHSLMNRCCTMILLDQEGRSWPVDLWYKKSDGQVYIGRGWKSCRVANGLKAGDPFIIQLIEKGKRPILKLCRLQANLEAKKEPIHHDAQVGSNLENSQPKIPEEELAKESSSTKLKKKQPMINLKAKASSVLQHPYFATKVTSSSVIRARMYIPRTFVKRNNLINSCEMILMDQKGRSWPAKFRYRASKREAYMHGWNAFRVANDLKPGDPVIFELIEKGERPVLKMHRLQANLEAKMEPIYHDAQVGPSSITPHFGVTMKASDLENSQPKVREEELAKESSSWKPHKKRQPMTATEAKASSSVQECSYFVAKVTSSSVIYNKMYIPTNVKMLNNLSNGRSEIILMDQEERSWPAKLWYKKSNGEAYIRDWNAFRVANDLKPGDSFIFQLIEERKMPILKMCSLKAKLKANKEQSRQDVDVDVETGSSSMRHPYFYVTAKASHLKNLLKIPRNFARRNNITSKCSKMILQNERGRSWLVSLLTDKIGGVYLGRGWTKFAKANGLRKGDVFMLELVEGGKTPIMKFYGVNQGTTCNKIYKDNAQRGSFENCQDVKPIIE